MPDRRIKTLSSGQGIMTEFLDAHSIARIIGENEIKSTDIVFEHVSC
jgi:hypothetical protein